MERKTEIRKFIETKKRQKAIKKIKVKRFIACTVITGVLISGIAYGYVWHKANPDKWQHEIKHL